MLRRSMWVAALTVAAVTQPPLWVAVLLDAGLVAAVACRAWRKRSGPDPEP